MKIAEIKSFALMVPPRPGRRTGKRDGTASPLIVEVTTDDDIRGYGEALARHADRAGTSR